MRGAILILVALAVLLMLALEMASNRRVPAGGALAPAADGSSEPIKPSVGNGPIEPVRVPVPNPRLPNHVIGAVVDESGAPIGGARVAAQVSARGSDADQDADNVAAWAPAVPVTLLAHTETDDRGKFRLPFDEVFAGGGSLSVDIVASRPGWRRAGVRGVSEADALAPLTIRMTRGLSVSGRVTRVDGEPVARVKMFACSDPRTKATGLRTSTTKSWMVSCDTALSDGYVWSECESDERGEFVLTGLPRGELFLNSLDESWMVKPMPTVAAGARDVAVVVTPALYLDLTVRGPSAGSVDSFSGIVQVAKGRDGDLGAPFSFTGRRGHTEVWIGCEIPEGGVRVRTVLSAPGCISRSGEHRLEGRRTSLTIDLDADETFEVPLLLLDRDGRRAVDLTVDYAAARDAGFRAAPVTLSGEATVAHLPSGLWHLRARSRRQFPTAPAFEAAVDVNRGRNAPVVGNLAGGATVTIDVRRVAGQEAIDFVEFRSNKGVLRLARHDAQAGLIVWESVPSAKWEIVVSPEGRDSLTKLVEVGSDDVWITFP